MTAAENKFFKEAVKEGLRMQHRFLAEPVLARTGKGYLKSEGVATLQRIKAGFKPLFVAAARQSSQPETMAHRVFHFRKNFTGDLSGGWTGESR